MNDLKFLIEALRSMAIIYDKEPYGTTFIPITPKTFIKISDYIKDMESKIKIYEEAIGGFSDQQN